MTLLSAPRPAAGTNACTCPDCAQLDLACPGDGLQLAIPLPPPPLRSRRRLADIEAEAFAKVHWQ